MTAEEYMINHPKGMNDCYWMLVMHNQDDIKRIQDVMEAYAKQKVLEATKPLKVLLQRTELESRGSGNGVSIGLYNDILNQLKHK